MADQIELQGKMHFLSLRWAEHNHLKTSTGTINNVKKGFNAFSLYFTLEFVNSAKH